jgi:hypothetical protein
MPERLQIIFLDIDGVLLPFPKTQQEDDDPSLLFPKSTLQALQRLLQATPGSQLVLSSTWRVRDDYIHDILKALQDFGIPIQDFHSITDPNLHSERQWEIYDWLQQKHQHQHQTAALSPDNIIWLALDDEELLYGDVNEKYRKLFTGHVIKTESREGLTMNDVESAIVLWEAQLVGKKRE